MKNLKIILTNIGISIVIIIIGFLFFEKKISQDLQNLEKSFFNLASNSGLELQENLTGNIFDLSTFENFLTKNISDASQSVVSILVSKNIKFYFESDFSFGPGAIQEQKTQMGGGSGILVTKDGYIITSKHIIEDKNADYSVITQDAKTYKVEKIWFDPVLDIAFLKISDENGDVFKPAKFVSISEEIKIGQFAIAIGNALSEYQNSVTLGIISAKNRQTISKNENIYVGLYQTDASINVGNSGGPLLNIKGEVIGINTAINEFAKGIGFSLPLNQEFVDSSIFSIQQNSKITRPEIGFQYLDINKKNKDSLKLDLDNGIYIKSVSSGSSAGLAGILPGDIITKINNLTINNDLPFLYQLYTFKVGDTLDFTILRNGDRKSITVKIVGTTD